MFFIFIIFSFLENEGILSKKNKKIYTRFFFRLFFFMIDSYLILNNIKKNCINIFL